MPMHGSAIGVLSMVLVVEIWESGEMLSEILRVGDTDLSASQRNISSSCSTSKAGCNRQGHSANPAEEQAAGFPYHHADRLH